MSTQTNAAAAGEAIIMLLDAVREEAARDQVSLLDVTPRSQTASRLGHAVARHYVNSDAARIPIVDQCRFNALQAFVEATGMWVKEFQQ